MKIHLIAIGGSIMHNLALALLQKGYHVTGSDDHIYEPAYSRLKDKGLLPDAMGWDEGKITKKLDLVILGMHAKPDNPELKRAQELKLKIMSFPEFIYEQSKKKKRIVIAGSHGKTSVTSMVMHVLQKNHYDFDYAVGSTLPGFENSVKLSNAQIIIIEGDEYLSSPIDPRPKFLWYQPQIALINGVAWDHYNVFPTYDIYKEQFTNFVKSMKSANELIYFAEDEETAKLVNNAGRHLWLQPFDLPKYRILAGKTVVSVQGSEYPVSVFGRHNLQNLAGAQKICEALGLDAKTFWQSVADFTGAGKRLEKIENPKGIVAFRDFAHAPSKVTATVNAMKEQYPDKKLVAILELHTFSSLNKDFIVQYAHSMDNADVAMVYVDNHALAAKGGDKCTAEQIKDAFQKPDVLFFDQKEDLATAIQPYINTDNALLFMSSGNFGGMEILGNEK